MKDTSRLLRGLWIPFILLPPLFAREFPHGRGNKGYREAHTQDDGGRGLLREWW